MIDEAASLEERLQAAFEEAIARQDGIKQPMGSYTKPGVWEPAEGERQACCDEVTKPTPGWGWSLKKHCESSRHVAQLFGVPEAALVKRVRQHKYERNRARKAAGMRITMDTGKAPAVSPFVAAAQVERLIAKLKLELANLERGYKNGDNTNLKAPDTGELDYWLRQLK